MCVNKKTGCPGCNAMNGCRRLKFANAKDIKFLPQSFESVYINITNSRYDTVVISNMDINAANVALQRAVK
ncbi:MAG TPA: hypothetical protein PLP23_13330 [Panacibacter sp.]|nr:hypothetical protein [Panacibacter sp.]